MSPLAGRRLCALGLGCILRLMKAAIDRLPGSSSGTRTSGSVMRHILSFLLMHEVQVQVMEGGRHVAISVHVLMTSEAGVVHSSQ